MRVGVCDCPTFPTPQQTHTHTQKKKKRKGVCVCVCDLLWVCDVGRTMTGHAPTRTDTSFNSHYVPPVMNMHTLHPVKKNSLSASQKDSHSRRHKATTTTTTTTTTTMATSNNRYVLRSCSDKRKGYRQGKKHTRTHAHTHTQAVSIEFWGSRALQQGCHLHTNNSSSGQQHTTMHHQRSRLPLR